jgi:valyl-tRNA synthetase
MPIYNQRETESSIYQLWEQSGFFNPDNLKVKKSAKSFSIIMPPPNANGSLHLGHAVVITLQDIMIRYKRMTGLKALWLPGADHAGFETQIVYEKKLEKEGRNRFSIPREQLYEEMMSFTLASRITMEGQLKQLGASCDWSRKKFTLDDDVVKIVHKTFKKLKADGLIYGGKRVSNWCVKHQTALSDIEIKYEPRQASLYYVKYFLLNKDGSISNDYLTVATTRPETIPADVAMAVNLKDARYKKYVGKYVLNPLNNNKLIIVSDRAVDKDFGTGVLKITPDHDRADEEICSRHTEIPKSRGKIINTLGRLEGVDIPNELIGLKTPEARVETEKLLAQKNCLDITHGENGINRNYVNSVAVCYKCNTVIEPLSLDNQLFLKVNAKPKNGGKSLRDLGLEAVKSNKIKFVPTRFKKAYIDWMDNLKDWNIS